MSVPHQLAYVLKSVIRYNSDKSCPFCGGKQLRVTDRKYWVSRLFTCETCFLMFRHPKDSTTHNIRFYNFSYRQKGMTTDLPDDAEVEKLKTAGFQNSERSVERVMHILHALNGAVENKRILDYGSSWGYNTWQFRHFGMQVLGFEISKARAAFGVEKLGVPIVCHTEEITGLFDFVFSAHVIEHLADIRSFFNLALSKLKPGGYLILLSPNGSRDLKQSIKQLFHKFWGEVHPNLLSDQFYAKRFMLFPYYISSSPYHVNHIREWDKASQRIELNNGDELLCIVKKNLLKRFV